MQVMQALTVCGLLMPGAVGCGRGGLFASRAFHQRCGWRAEEYFADPLVIALCRAIEAKDLAEMERLVKDGADINARGKDGMTPLLWAFPDNQLPRFKWLLEHGANPNVPVDGGFHTRQMISRGDSVTYMVCKTSFPGYFDAVFDNGGDPNLKHTGPVGFSYRPLFTVISSGVPEKKEKVRRLIALGADMDALALGVTPLGLAVAWGGQCDIALVMLHAGANFRTYGEDQIQRLIHWVARQERRLPEYTDRQRADFDELVKWLEDHGESYAKAKADLDRWDSWSGQQFRQKMDAEIAERKAREKTAAGQERD